MVVATDEATPVKVATAATLAPSSNVRYRERSCASTVSPAIVIASAHAATVRNFIMRTFFHFSAGEPACQRPRDRARRSADPYQESHLTLQAADLPATSAARAPAEPAPAPQPWLRC